MSGCGKDKDVMVDPCIDNPHLAQCPNNVKQDGGEIRFENQMYPEGNTVAVANAMFWKNQNPPNMKFPAINTCIDYSTDTYFPLGSQTGHVAVQMHGFEVTREFLDVGSTVSALSSNGMTVDLVKHTDNYDWLGRWNNTFYIANGTEMFGGIGIDPAVLGGTGSNARVDLAITLEGTMDFTARTFNGLLGSASPGISIPARPENVRLTVNGNPVGSLATEMNTMTNPAQFAIFRGADLKVEWDHPTGVDGDRAVTFFNFLDANRQLQATCVTDQKGSFVVSAADLEKVPDQGALLFGFLYHQFQDIDGRRIDMVGTSCRIGYFAKMDPM
jgi:hypothetical protein